MALARPVVASDIPMVHEAIGDHAAALVPVDDPRSLAAAIARCLSDPVAAAQAGTAARARFDATFTPGPVVEQLRRLYVAATQGRMGPATPVGSDPGPHLPFGG
jgi:glycosyltransferase involved in cell wall biosynthesis